MINTNRIVPIQNTDLLSLYGLILKQDTTNNSGLTALAATAPGVFTISDGSAPLVAAEPVKSLNSASAVSAYTIYFVAAYDFAGFTTNGAAATMAGADIVADASTLFKAVLSSGTVTISKVSL